MQPTDFSIYLTNFLSKYLPAERGASRNTIAAYRDTFVLLIIRVDWCQTVKLNSVKA